MIYADAMVSMVFRAVYPHTKLRSGVFFRSVRQSGKPDKGAARNVFLIRAFSVRVFLVWINTALTMQRKEMNAMQMEAAESRRIRPVWREKKSCGNLVPQRKSTAHKRCVRKSRKEHNA